MCDLIWLSGKEQKMFFIKMSMTKIRISFVIYVLILWSFFL